MRKLFTSTLMLIGAALLSTPASAAPITGKISFAGGIVYQNRGALTGLSVLNFDPQGVGTGNIATVAGTTDYFTNIDLLSTAQILDLTNDITASGVPGPAFAPSGIPVAINNFLSNFADPDAAGLSFQLTKVLNQSGAVCNGTEGLGDVCVEGPFSLNETNNGLKVNFDVQGYFTKGADIGFFKGAFSTNFGGLKFAEAFRRLDVSGQNLMCGTAVPPTAQTNNLQTSCGFTADFQSTPVPEPATLLTFGAGLALLGAVVRRRKAQVNG